MFLSYRILDLHTQTVQCCYISYLTDDCPIAVRPFLAHLGKSGTLFLPQLYLNQLCHTFFLRPSMSIRRQFNTCPRGATLDIHPRCSSQRWPDPNMRPCTIVIYDYHQWVCKLSTYLPILSYLVQFQPPSHQNIQETPIVGNISFPFFLWHYFQVPPFLFQTWPPSQSN